MGNAIKKFQEHELENQNLCVHPFCIDCITTYISVKLVDNIVEIPCPFPNCNHFLDPIGCRNLMDSDLFDKWSEKLCEYSVLGLTRCYCPYQNCSALILDECGGVATLSKCPNCKRLFCFRCKLPWHAGFQCEESGALRDENDFTFGMLAEREKWQRCPKCRSFVQLSEGCRYITCRCQANFCYKCGMLLDRSHGWCACYFPSNLSMFSRICLFVLIHLAACLFLFIYIEVFRLYKT
uniref:RBR-type E3 ubiquitin transferase n=1 Tax=Solanum lycopersicum TaxID=4081 RepID=A0A3Q7ETE8_SOLLC|nr:probable E3 ubiquitin-protein ligase RNF217 [Solanum lycopersicum]